MKTLSSSIVILIAICLLNSCGSNSKSYSIVTPPFFHRSPDFSFETVAEENSINRDKYTEIIENEFVSTSKEAISSFSTDADGASYTNLRRYIFSDKILPPAGAIRTEELINYFDMQYGSGDVKSGVSMHSETSSCPWNRGHSIMRIGLKGKTLSTGELPSSNFVFLIDVSGSMDQIDKLHMIKKGFVRFVEKMRETDKVAIVTYAGYSKTVLLPTEGRERDKITDAINNLSPEGSTDGSKGILTAYDLAEKSYIKGGNNRIILATDGDFNVGITDSKSLVELIEKKRESDIYITIMGVGRGNLNDASMEQMADNGNGNYVYIDREEEMEKVFVDDLHSFYPVAKDVKIQVKFNPVYVDSYRLIGYENRIMSKEEFIDNAKDAGEISSGQSLTAIYEIVLKPGIEASKEHVAIVDLRYKGIHSDSLFYSNLEIYNSQKEFEQATNPMKLSAGISAYAMLLRGSKFKGGANYNTITEWLNPLLSWDSEGRIKELIQLVEASKTLQP